MKRVREEREGFDDDFSTKYLRILSDSIETNDDLIKKYDTILRTMTHHALQRYPFEWTLEQIPTIAKETYQELYSIIQTLPPTGFMFKKCTQSFHNWDLSVIENDFISYLLLVYQFGVSALEV